MGMGDNCPTRGCGQLGGHPGDCLVIAPTRDEAIALCMSDAPDGEHIITHQPDCECDPNGDGCTCEPDVHIVKRGAA